MDDSNVDDGYDAPALTEIAMAEARKRDYANARTTFERALEADPQHGPALFGLGGVLFRTGSHSNALTHLEKAYALQPDYPKLEALLAKVRAKLNPPDTQDSFGTGGDSGVGDLPGFADGPPTP